MSMSDKMFGLSCSSGTLDDMIQNSIMNGFSFVHCSIIDPGRVISMPASLSLLPFVRSDLNLSEVDLSAFIVDAVCCHNIIDEGQANDVLRASSLFEKELMIYMHLGILSVTVSLNAHSNTNIARVLSSLLLSNSNGMEVWARIPLMTSTSPAGIVDERVSGNISSWKLWKTFHSQTNYSSRVGLVIELTAQLPSMVELDRLLSEPIKGIILPTSIFTTNAKGFPVLSVAHQLFLCKVASLCTYIFISGRAKCKTLTEYITYLDHLLSTSTELDSPGDTILQTFPQPLIDNYSMALYEHYERDEAKYKLFYLAIHEALLDQKKSSSQPKVIVILGASTGSLVRVTVEAAKSAGVPIKVFAVEKNYYACKYLEERVEQWEGTVISIHNCDAWKWTPPEPCDVLISELLGSFGDHDLSPEYLAQAHKWLKAGGITIPCRFTSFVTPIQSSKLFKLIRSSARYENMPLKKFETPYIISEKNVFHVAPAQKMFSFDLPNSKINPKSLLKKLRFNIKQDCTLHGFNVYFEAQLYKDIVITSLPSDCVDPSRRKPMLLPLYEEVQLKEGVDLIYNIWRVSEKERVWYEWAVSMPSQTHIHNLSGRSSFYTLPPLF